ncbi:3-dehydroquinate synthase [Oceanihabitans sediminis]|uniref:3-dehydroquinate synthase n=1 Tax=Oceanihabitans sediminis TaxID=1812012 RepID=A0A368P4Q6_9FLAO|nr:3-dehydroquinate synthase [Oceanihabitans sediminis]RBP33041.1 3-dehydroquinate synthase [Oceanihabitans sediminis]RCU57443.1 3-dehydroquinate synthase [Oceanihabitans sediminis]
MTTLKTQDYSIFFNEKAYESLNKHLSEANYSKIFIIADENTNAQCVPHILANIDSDIVYDILEIESGEVSKNIEICVGLWEALSDYGADRKSLILNIGGGVITDLGGFIASTFKRGIHFINIPTSILAMVDASIGGKTGIDLGHLKNQIGVINTPKMVLIDTYFLNTLPENQMRSGFAEMLKHGLIANEAYWNKFKDLSKLTTDDVDELIYESIKIKKDIVEQDPLEENLRKTLNFGHTLGHAIESYFLSNPKKEPLLHGEAIAVGMILASYISTKTCNLATPTNQEIKDTILSIFGKVKFEQEDYNPIIELLIYDKKNEHGNINFVLLETIGKPKINCTVSNETILEAFEFYES